MPNTRVFLNFCQVTSCQNSRVTHYVLHTSQFMCCMRAIFVCCRQAILCVLHDSKKHTSQTLCAAHKSVFLCAPHELTDILCQIRINAYNEMTCKQNMTKCMDMQKIAFFQVYTHLYSNLLWMTLYHTT